MSDGRCSRIGFILVGAAAVTALLAFPAHAKPWTKWAPAPLASDSSYAALSARPADSLTASQLQWLGVQRDWRAQRDLEAKSSRRTVSAADAFAHVPRPTDKRFATLASRPYGALADSERAWLADEHQMQIAERAAPGVSGVAGFALFLGLLGIVGLVVVVNGVDSVFPPW